MDNVIPFERIKDVTGWTVWEIRQYAHAKDWENFRIKFNPETNETKIVRLPK